MAKEANRATEMKRRSGLSSRPIEFMPRRFYFIITREVSPCVVHPGKYGDDSSTASTRQQTTPETFPSSMRTLFPRTPGIQFISLHDQLPRATPCRKNQDDSDSDGDEFDLDIRQTLRFNDFLTRLLTSTASSRPSPMPSESLIGNGTSGIHQYSPHYFFVRRERLAEVVKAIHLICRWRLLYLGMTPQEALAPFEHFPFLFSTFFAPQSRFQPPNLLGSLLGIAKGISSDLLVHADMESWWLVGSFDGEAANESQQGHSSGGDKAEENEAEAETASMLIPISRRFVVCRARRALIRKGRRARVGADKTDGSGIDGIPVFKDNESQPLIKRDDRSTQLLVSHLKSANIALTIVLSGGELASSGNDDGALDSRTSALMASLASSGLSILDLSTPLGGPSNELVCSAGSSDGTLDESVVDRFLDACEQTQGTIAVSSVSAFGATPTEEYATASTISAATCIGCYLMKHHSFTSQEAVGWIRYCWPEEISLARQLFLDQMQPRMWRDGDRFRRRLQLQQQQEAAENAMMLENGSVTRLGSQISIGRISLGRDSLFGTKSSGRSDDGDRGSDPDDRPSYSRLHRHHQSHLSLHQHLQSSQDHAQSDTESNDEEGNALTDEPNDHHAMRSISSVNPYPGAQLAVGKQRRPLTQGSAISARRLHRPSDGAGFARADFSLLHKFVHQTTVPRNGSASHSTDNSSRAAAAASGFSVTTGLAVGSAMAAAVARASTAETAALTRMAADVVT